ncbi:MAG: CusA/CzcA family heavy metal efflux transporter [Hydrocarboniphaga sp.]|uniref:efflux RND transporter permease subunit n=1 Tax=Hydrocarboniphaga sp. TaxID=2033016 RepID=UPI00262DA6E0|nr:efflux RND transporter permease subunit [Hydrocarboniphaga sp.]MDB5969726.1 CusA/CzcA family heavy metal efflux transporter [Hydrocarboniphaga sp.]
MISKLVAWSLRERLLVLVAAAVLLLLGALRLRDIPVDVLPDLARPTVSVQVEAPQLATEDVESLVSYPLESALAGLPGLQRLRSTSTPGLSLIQVEFDWGSDLYRQRQLVTERLEAARGSLPPGLQPRLGPITSLMGEVMLLGLRSPQAAVAPAALREWADWAARPALLAVPGVAQVLVIGGELRQFEVRPDLQRMRLSGITLAQIETAVRGYGSNGGAGIVEEDARERVLRTIGRPFDLDGLRQAAVAWRGNAPIRLQQVAEVAEGRRIKRGDAGVDGEAAVILTVQKQPGVDSLQLDAAIERRLQQLRGGMPGDAVIEPVFRQADFIEAAVGNVRDALLHGALIAALVLLLFLGSGRATLAAAVAIPLSLISAVLLLHGFGFSIDTMTLGGLAIAVGELVDDAVVGVDNVVRRLREAAERDASLPRYVPQRGTTRDVRVQVAATREGRGSVDAVKVIVRAVAEVRSGILVATVVIVLAIAPVLALGGVAGRLFAPLACAYVAAILASLGVALTVTPALCLLGLDGGRSLPAERAWVRGMRARYTLALGRALARPRLLLLATAALAAIALLAALLLPRTFLPPFSERTLTVNLVLRPGIALAESQRVALLAEQQMLAVPGVIRAAHRSGRAEADEHAEGVHYSEFDVTLAASASRTQVQAAIRQALAGLPGSLSIGAPIAHRLDHVLSGVRAPLAVKLIGDDLATLRRLAAELAGHLQHDPRLTGVQVEQQTPVAQWQTRVDPVRAGAWGLSPPRVQEQIAVLAGGQTLGQIVEGERRFDLVLRLPEAQRLSAALPDLLIESPAGPVPLSSIAESALVDGESQILRENLRRRLVVSAYPSAALAPAADAVADALAGLHLPAGYEASVEGEAAEQRSTLARLLLLGLVSLLLMSAVIHARYRDPRLTAIVMAMVPLSAIGGIAALALTRTPLSAASAVGFVTLFGIATRNTLLKLSHCLNLARESPQSELRALVLRACSERLLPVLMTALVAALALAPLLWAGDAPGKEILHPVALVIFGGLLCGTALDSFVTPILIYRYAGAAVAVGRQSFADV